MTREDELRHLYAALDAAGGDPAVAASLGEIIAELGRRLFPDGFPNLATFEAEGRVYTVDRADRFGRACYFGSPQERLDTRLFASLCRSDDVVWDIGANFGLYTVAVASVLGPGGRVIAAEPGSRARELLVRNVEGNGLEARTTVLSCAVADRDGEGVFYDAVETAFSGLSDTGRSRLAATMPVEMRSLASIAREQGVARIDMMKVDVEGHELDVLRGGRDLLLASPDPLVQIEVSSKNMAPAGEAALHDMLRELARNGLDLWHVDWEQGARSLDAEGPDFMRQAQGNLLMTKSGTSRETALLASVEVLMVKQEGKTTEREGALMVALGAVARAEKEKRLRSAGPKASKGEGPSTSAMSKGAMFTVPEPPVRVSVIGRRSLRPYALSDISRLSLIVRVIDQMQDIGPTLGAARRYLEELDVLTIIADCRPQLAPPLSNFTDAWLISPPLGEAGGNRYQAGTVSALRAASGSHALLLTAGACFVDKARIMDLVSQWRDMALRGETVGAIALDASEAGTLANAVVSLAAFSTLPDTAPPFRGRGIDRHLALQMEGAGFQAAKLEAACVSMPLDAHASLSVEADRYDSEWLGRSASAVHAYGAALSGFRD